MIFIPFFGKIDWSNPPLATFFLIIANCLIFFTFQGGDNGRAEQAFEYYLGSELPALEMPRYANYLDTQNDWKRATQYRDYLEQNNLEQKGLEQKSERQATELMGESGKMQLMILAAPMKMDPEFYRQLQSGALFEDKNEFQKWQALDSEFQSRMNKITTFQYGLKPNDPTVLTLFSNMFLHGGFGHLLGNMIFLFIIGFVVETALGKTAYSAGYILTGLAGGFLYIAFNSNSHVPTVGASGAIAGLMGMYTVLFGLRKINFFYFVLVYFDYVKAPAIILLPIWLGHEIFQLLASSNDSVNYYAHIGGIASGALFAAVMKYLPGKVNTLYLDRDEIAGQTNDQFEAAMDYLARMQVDKSLAILRPLVEQHPDNRDYLLQWYKAGKLQPAGEDFHKAAQSVMMLKDKNAQTYQLIYNTYREYMKLAQPKAQLNAGLCLHLILTFALGKYFNEAETLLALVKNHKMKQPVAETILALANAFQKTGEQNKCRSYLAMLTEHYAGTAAATEAAQRLHALRDKAG